MQHLIETLQNKQLIWQGNAKQSKRGCHSTGHSELDKQLNGGFPESGIIEVLSDIAIGELRLLLPTLTDQSNRLLVFIAPPGGVNGHFLLNQGIDLNKVIVIYPEDQTSALWSAEQCLKSGACYSVVMWAYESLAIHQVKRLKLASEKGQCRQFMMRRQRCESLSLPVDLSISLTAADNGLNVRVNKQKFAWPSALFSLSMRAKWPKLTKTQLADNVIVFPHTKVG
ncbi:translesion DNA synthesis-associated protein ImuA [Thalassotalea sp. LPB0316]|uniref:translesion DNA synthesis-associated protein ImuA n=1 Tax=Thalassotalea sp. LPB0316 TaxID=2769490 RepID=UPI001868CC5B|nr:translesion DNA synthesis-associated protein ImuA [Thalassotalea sp. LPB0316]QOL27171.1 translesion DNA synthesis-associated protein ImuA [Thalassotalea sp. LPB0316]